MARKTESPELLRTFIQQVRVVADLAIFFPYFLKKKINFLKNYLTKIIEIFTGDTTKKYLSYAAKLEFESLFV